MRPLALAVVVATSLLAPVGISAQAAEDDLPTETAPTSDPVVPTPVPDPGATVADPAPVSTPPSAPAASPPSNPPPTAVTVSRAGTSASKSVSIVDFGFKPGSITVNTGDTVQWTNNGEVPEGHDVTGDGLDSGLMNPGDTYSHTFSATGTFSYICTIHPSMTGTVKVLERSSCDSGCPQKSLGSDTAVGAETAALSSPGAAGTVSALPASGEDALPLATVGLWLLALGLGIRVLAPGVLRRGS